MYINKEQELKKDFTLVPMLKDDSQPTSIFFPVLRGKNCFSGDYVVAV